MKTYVIVQQSKGLIVGAAEGVVFAGVRGVLVGPKCMVKDGVQPGVGCVE